MTDGIVVYVSSAGTAEVLGFLLDAREGRLEPLGRSAVPASNRISPTSMPLALAPDQRTLYVAVRSAPYGVTSFAIERRTGGLEALATAPLADNMAYISTDRTGRHLFSASYVGGKVSINPIDADGAVRRSAIQQLKTPPKAHCILADPTNQWVLATSLGGDVVLRFAFDSAAGLLSPLADSLRTRPGAGPRHLTFHPSGRLVHLLNELDGHVNVYGFDAVDGRLEERQSIPMLEPSASHGFSAADIHLTPDGRHLYASERATSSIAGFSVEAASGILTPVGAWGTDASPRGFNITPCGRFLLVAGQASNRVSAYAIDRGSGRLEHIHRQPAGSNPNWIESIAIPAMAAEIARPSGQAR